MPFIAICPRCQNSQFRVPTRKRGTLARCPRCRAEFPLVPQGEEVAVEAVRLEAVAPAPAAAPAHTQPDEARRMALIALATVAVALLASQIAYGRAVALVLAAAGAALAVMSTFGLETRAWLGWLGVGANAVVLLTVLAVPERLGITGWSPAAELAAPQPEQPVDEWVDAGLAAWEEGGVRVVLTFANVAPDPNATGTAKKERYLWIGVKVTNVGERSREFAGWGAAKPFGPVLMTADWSPIATRSIGKPGPKVPLATGQTMETLLMFDQPSATDTGDLMLELPPEAFGGNVPVRFRLSRSLIARK